MAPPSSLRHIVDEAADRVGRDRTRLLDVAREVQARERCVSNDAMRLIAKALRAPLVEVEALVSFYAFLSREPTGEHVIHLSDCPACRGADGGKTAQALQEALGIRFGQTTADRRFSLARTSCIGLCDQGPAALADMRPVPGLTAARVPELLGALRAGGLAAGQFPVLDHVRKRDQVVLGDRQPGAGLRRAITLSPADLIAEVKASRLRGRGGAGFPTGSKWELAQRAGGTRKVIVCNADEGEPGTFKDRIIFSLEPGLVLEGMAVAGWAVGASLGIIYLRAEYEFLLERILGAAEEARRAGLLGRDILGHKGFDFDVRVQLGAGAYVCGEESALISSLEGRYGVPKDRPPFPAERGYLELPTVVNNVETLCCAARVAEKGPGWFAGFGLGESTGTKLLSVSGDCARPGIYEMPLGAPVREFLAEVGGEKAQAVLVGGPSGSFIGPADFGRELGFHDLPTGGSMMVFGPERDLLEVASDFMHFFVEESCGWCTPCRVGNVLLKERLDRIRAGKGAAEDLGYLEDLCQVVKKMSRCGLGQTSSNPVQSTLSRFRPLYEARLRGAAGSLLPSFDLEASVAESARLQGRAPALRKE